MDLYILQNESLPQRWDLKVFTFLSKQLLQVTSKTPTTVVSILPGLHYISLTDNTAVYFLSLH